MDGQANEPIEEQQLTVEQVIEITINNLMVIRVPAMMAEEIGVPIQKNIGNLRQCLTALKAAREAKTKEAEADGRAAEVE